ncbi:hypothetical protein AYO20_11048 [Fonsecaea nubica]|uniref:Uncharacterized protein n=1 Tax=Fonsecaea nubica TaxID=856822 RepID=A0A178BZV7_9EURO|nr:hypothetical protein AYO20_11048 [Fonsecaea nubica]OAL23180.1 hypothetical protein AYO20_11048 [Fonsecaea nubica]
MTQNSALPERELYRKIFLEKSNGGPTTVVHRFETSLAARPPSPYPDEDESLEKPGRYLDVEDEDDEDDSNYDSEDEDRFEYDPDFEFKWLEPIDLAERTGVCRACRGAPGSGCPTANS